MSDQWERWAALWWQTLPMRGARLGKWARRALADGLYLAAWPLAAALAPPACLIIGLLTGWFHPGFDSMYTASAVFLSVAAAIGAAGAQPGLAFTVGYAIGDFFLRGSGLAWHSRAGLWDMLAPMLGLLLAYFLLSQLTVFMPLIASGARRLARLPRPAAAAPRLLIEMAVYGLLCAGACYLWTVATPVLIRPAFTWRGSIPTVDAMRFLQMNGEWLAMIAGLAGAGRMALEAAAMRNPAGRRRVVTYVARLRVHGPERPSRVFPIVSAIVSAALGTLLLAGALATWVDALLLGAFFTVMNLLRQGRLFRLPGAWLSAMGRLPFLARLIAAYAATWVLARWILRLYWNHGGNTFRPVVLTVVVAVVLVYVLCPPGQRTGRSEEVTAP